MASKYLIGLVILVLSSHTLFSSGPAFAETLSLSEQSPAMRDSRSYLDSYGFWLRDGDGTLYFFSLLLSNLAGTPTQPGFSMTALTKTGEGYRASGQWKGEDLVSASDTLDIRFAGNSLSLKHGIYHLTLKGKATSLAGSALGDFNTTLEFHPQVPSHRWGDGILKVGEDEFYLSHLFTRGLAKGGLSVGTQSVKIDGIAYGDHSWQTAWAHHIAQRWVNFRFFAEGQTLAASTWVDPSGQSFSRALLASDKAIIATSDGLKVILGTGDVDGSTGYALPTHLKVDMPKVGTLDVALAKPADRQDLMEDVNPVVKQMLQWWIAKPFTYRYQLPATLNGPSGAVDGHLVVEVVYVNEG